MKKFDKWAAKRNIAPADKELCRLAWREAIVTIIRTTNRRNKIFEGNWQHEDISCLIEDMTDML